MWESKEPKTTTPRDSSKAKDSLTSPSVLNSQSSLPFLASNPYTEKLLLSQTTTLSFLEYAGEDCTIPGVACSHIFFPVSASRATMPPRLFQSPNSSPTKTKPRSSAIQGDEPIQSASINIHCGFPVLLSRQ